MLYCVKFLTNHVVSMNNELIKYIHFSNFHVRKTDSVEKSYLAGRYLTSPNVDLKIL